MKRRIILKMGYVILSLLTFSIIGLNIHRNQFLKTDFGSYIDKLNYLKSVEGKKAVFVGGSSTNFSIHAKQFQAETGITSVNMGLNAGISFNLYMKSVTPYLKSGDILFLIPEYDYYCNDYYEINESSVSFLLYLDPETARQVDLKNYVMYVKNFINAGWKNWGYFSQELIKSKLFHEGFSIYFRNSINENGDMVAHKNLPNKTIAPYYYHVGGFFNKGFANELAKVAQELKNKGVTVYLTFPAFEKSSFDESKSIIDQIYANVTFVNSWIVLGKPENFVYPYTSFFDSYYHLNYNEGSLHTKKLTSNFMNEK